LSGITPLLLIKMSENKEMRYNGSKTSGPRFKPMFNDTDNQKSHENAQRLQRSKERGKIKYGT